MKGFKKLLTGILASAMAVSMALGSGAVNVQAETTTPTTGSVTITNATVGESYQGFMIFSATLSDNADAISYKWAGSTASMPTNDYFVTNDNGYIDATDKAYTETTDVATGKTTRTLTPGAIDTLTGWVKNTNNTNITFESTALTPATAPADSTATEVTLTFDNLQYGYWYFTSTVGAVVSIDSTHPNASITDKNEDNTSEKRVLEDSLDANAIASYGDRNDAEIGQYVKYRSTVTIKKGSKHVVFHDQMTVGLTFKSLDNVLVVADKETLTGTVLDSGNYEKDKAEDKGENDTFSISFKDDYTTGLENDVVIAIEYTATLNEDAVVYPTNADKGLGYGNDNQSWLTWGNNSRTQEDWTRTYTYKFDLFKYTKTKEIVNGVEKEVEKPLANAKFTLQRNDQTKTYVSLTLIEEAGENDTTSANVYRVNNGVTGTEENATVITPASGLVEFVGLDADTYILKETEAPAGYNLLKDPKTIVISSETSTQTNNNAEGHFIGVPTVNSAAINTAGDGIYKEKILNNAGTLLPSTGGIGTTIFYIIGGLLIVAGVAYFIVRRKANAE